MSNPCQTTNVLLKRASRGGVVVGLAPELFWATPRSLLHWIVLLLCSKKRPMRKGQILARGDVGAVKYLSCGRNIVQQEAEFRKGKRNYGCATITLFALGPSTRERLAGIATRGSVEENQVQKKGSTRPWTCIVFGGQVPLQRFIESHPPTCCRV
jgi:hypothetical protein